MRVGRLSGLISTSSSAREGHSPRAMLCWTVGIWLCFMAIRSHKNRSRQNGSVQAIRQPVCRMVPPEGPSPSIDSTASITVSTGATVCARSTSIEQKSSRFWYR